MQIHELAQQIHNDAYQVRTIEFDSLEAGEVLDMCVPHESKLERGEFAKTDYGYVDFDLGNVVPGNGQHPSQLDSIEVRYRLNDGVNIRVGNIVRRLGRESSTGVVSVYRYGESNGTRIKPEDERWGTIVGCVRDAVAECEARKAT